MRDRDRLLKGTIGAEGRTYFDVGIAYMH